MPPLINRQGRHSSIVLFLFVFSVYAFFARGNLGLDAQVRYEVAGSMVRGDGFSAGKLGAIPWTRDGQTVNYGVFGVGQSVMMAPVALGVSMLDERGTTESDNVDATNRPLRRAVYAFLSIIFFPAVGAGAIVALYGLVREAGLSPAVSLRYALVAAFATPMLIYAGDGQEVSQIVGLLAAGAWLTLKAVRAPGRRGYLLLLAAAVCFWVMPVFRTQNLLEAGMFSAWAIVTWYRARAGGPSNTSSVAHMAQWFVPALMFAIPAAASLGWLLLFNWLRFGSVTTDSYDIIFRHRGIDPFSHPFLRGFFGPIISADKGILWFCPALFVAIIAALRRIALPRPLTEISLLAAMCFSITAAALARYISWGGDHAVGPRLEMHLVPFMLLPMVGLLGRQSVAMWVKLILSISIVVQLAGKALDPALEIYQNPRASNVTPELSPQHGPGRFINRFANLGEKASGQLTSQWEAAAGRPLTEQERVVTDWDVFWIRAWKSGNAAGIAMSMVAAALAGAALILWRRLMLMMRTLMP